MGIALKWIGNQGQFVAGYPADDCEVETQAEADALVAGGLYETVKVTRTPKTAEQGGE